MKKLILIFLVTVAMTACGGKSGSNADDLVSKDPNFDAAQALDWCSNGLKTDLDELSNMLEKQQNRGNTDLEVNDYNAQEMANLFEALDNFIKNHSDEGSCKLDENYTQNGNSNETEVIWFKGEESIEIMKKLRTVIATNLYNYMN